MLYVLLNLKYEEMKVGLAADHAGYELKQFVKGMLEGMNIEVVDFGTNSTESVDYPDYAHPLALALESGEVTFGFAFCGSGNGIAITLNRYPHVRAALCWTAEIARLAREHNDANVCSMPSRFITTKEAAGIVEAFLDAKFEGGRHQRRIEKMGCR